MEWNSLRRIKSAFKHQEPDRTPIFEYALLRPQGRRRTDKPHSTGQLSCVQILGG